MVSPLQTDTWTGPVHNNVCSQHRLQSLNNRFKSSFRKSVYLLSEPWVITGTTGTTHHYLINANSSLVFSVNQIKFDALIKKHGDDFVEYIQNQDLSDREKALWQFQYYMRYGISLSSGSIVDYRKYVAGYLDENGELDAPENLGSHHRAAVNKFRDFNKKTGDSDE